METKILLVDDELNVLQGYYRNLRLRFPVEVAMGTEQAIQAMENHGPIGVVVSDMRMPGRSGVDLLEEIRHRWPRTIRIMLTGDAEQHTAVDAVNRGMIFRFLRKPCGSAELAGVIESGVRQHELERAEKVLLEETLTGTLKVLSEILQIAEPGAFCRVQQLCELADKMADQLDYPDPWELSVAAMLAPLGRMMLPPGVAEKRRTGASLSREEQNMLALVPSAGARLLEQIPRMGQVAEIIRFQDYRNDSPSAADRVFDGGAVPFGARILCVIQDFIDKFAVRGDPAVALEAIRMDGWMYDSRVVEALGTIIARHPLSLNASLVPCALTALQEGMVLGGDLRTARGHVLLPSGMRLGKVHLQFVRDAARIMELEEPFLVTRS